MYEYGSKVQINDKQHPQHLHVGTICGFVDVVGEPTAYYIDIGIASVHAYWYQLDALSAEPPLDGGKPVDYYLDSMRSDYEIGVDWGIGHEPDVDEYGMQDDSVNPYSVQHGTDLRLDSQIARYNRKRDKYRRNKYGAGNGYDYEPVDGMPPLANDRDGVE